MILLGLGLQHKEIDDIAKELDLPGTQILGLFNRVIRKVVQVHCVQIKYTTFTSLYLMIFCKHDRILEFPL